MTIGLGAKCRGREDIYRDLCVEHRMGERSMVFSVVATVRFGPYRPGIEEPSIPLKTTL